MSWNDGEDEDADLGEPYTRSTPEQERLIDETLGIVLLPPIRIPKLVHEHLVSLAKAKGIILQAMARQILCDEIETWYQIREWAAERELEFEPVRKLEEGECKGTRRRKVDEFAQEATLLVEEDKFIATDQGDALEDKFDEGWWYG